MAVRWFVRSFFFCWLLVASGATAKDGLPYLYQRVGSGEERSSTVEYEAAYGTRDSRFFGTTGVEQGLRGRFQPWPFLNFEAWGGILVNHGRVEREAASFDLNWHAFSQASYGVDLHLGAGYIYDYRGHHVPRLRATLGRRLGDLDLMFGTLLELPVGPGRDQADLMFGLAGSFLIAGRHRLGLEACAEDIEGLWEPEEAEGGAKFLLGPTAWFQITEKIQIKANAALVVAYLRNQRPSAEIQLGDEVGFMGRLVLGYSF